MDAEWRRKVDCMTTAESWKTLYSDKKKVQGDHSVWGPGNVYRNSAQLVELLPEILTDLYIKTFFDVGCGDFLWLSKVIMKGVDYTGVDIVAEMIEDNRTKYPSHSFDTMNIIDEVPPMVDMIFMRSVLIHTSLDDCKKIIANVKQSGSKYLMVSTMPLVEKNADTSHLWLVQRNLLLEPFNLPEPLYLIPEMNRDDVNNFMGIWEINDIN